MSRLEQLIDHAAELQGNVNRLELELKLLGLALIAASVLLALLTVRLWPDA